MLSFELEQPLSQQMQNQKKVGDNKNRVDHELNRKSSDCFGCFLFHQQGKVAPLSVNLPAASIGCVQSR